MGEKRVGVSMSTEIIPHVKLEENEAAFWVDKIGEYSQEKVPVVYVEAVADDWEKIKAVLCELRGSNISCILLLKRADDLYEDDEILAIFDFLRDWDQLLLQNVLEMCAAWIPKAFITSMETEAKVEMKWFEQWLSALSDERIYKFPGLPWRSFIRKIVKENHAFAVRFLELVALPATNENIQAVQGHFNRFLEAKKKVVCTFPKHWSRGA